MTIKRVLNRLLRLRELEEELSRMELESAVAAETRAGRAVDAARERQAMGRQSFVAGVERGDAAERAGGLAAMAVADRARAGLLPRFEEAKAEVVRQREEFLARRTGRKQVETLLDAARREAAAKDLHRAQQMLDDWYGRKSRGMRQSETNKGTEA